MLEKEDNKTLNGSKSMDDETSLRNNKSAIPFRIYYDAGITYDGNPFNAPAWGVLLICERDAEHGRRIVAYGDYYCWKDGQWYNMDKTGMLDYLAQPGERKVIFGRFVDNQTWKEAYHRADTDPDFPQRTAYHPREVRQDAR
jgi:hypothetical protein